MRLLIRVGALTMEAELNDTATAQQIAAALPIRTGFNTWGDEIYFSTPVDAPLDDANVSRFLKMIRHFSQETQFVVITHNEEKPLPPAFLRRCIFHYVEFPATPADAEAILRLHGLGRELSAEASREVTAGQAAPFTLVVLDQDGQPMPSTQLLSQLIRFYGDSLQGFMGSYLDRSMQTFLEQQQQFRQQMGRILG